jgi:DNA polymerase-1
MDEAQALAWTRSDQGLAGKDLYFINTKHDLQMYRNWGVDLEALGCKLKDIAFREALLDDHRGYGGLDLESLSTSRLGLQKEQLGHSYVDKGRMAETHSSEVGTYAERDSWLLWKLDLAYQPLIEAEDLGRVLALEDNLIYCVAEMERNGLRLDHEKAVRWDQELANQYGELIMEIWRLTGLRVNPNSGPDLSRLFKQLNLRPPAHTEDGNESFPASEIEKMGHQVIDLVVKARRVDSLRSKYFKKFKAAGSHLYYSLHQLKGNEYGTISGRFSGTNSCQQLLKVARQVENFGPDHLVRECVIPDDGFDLLAADAKQIEPRLFVHYAQLLDTPTSRWLKKEYDKDPELDFYKLVQGMVEKIPALAAMDAKTRRMYVKVGTLGKFYGLSSAESAAEQLKCTPGEAERFMREYDEEFDIVRKLMNLCVKVGERRGYIKTILGRRARLKDKNKAYVLMNRLMQGSAADVNKVKLLEVYNNKKTLGVHKMRLTVHDEIVADVAKDPNVLNQWRNLLDKQTIPELKIPILWDANVGATWKDCA